MKKDLNFEINILPILDILSVLICFLLLTAVWVQIGTLDTKQALGDNSMSGAKNPPSLWITMKNDGLHFDLRDLTTSSGRALQGTLTGAINWVQVTSRIQAIHTQIPDLKTVVIRPDAKVNYGDVIHMMDQLKQNELTDVGLSPLG